VSLFAAAVGSFEAPHIDWHALAPELALLVGLVAALLVDLFSEDHQKLRVAYTAALAMVTSLFFCVTLGLNGADREMFGGAYVVDDYAIIVKALFAVIGYVVLFMSISYIEEGDYYQGEYSVLMLGSILGMTIMVSSRELLLIFVALELLSIPAYLLAGWRKRDVKGNEGMMKYYLLGVFASAVMLYGMTLIYGVTGSTMLTDISASLAQIQAGGGTDQAALAALGILFIIIGFAFKVSAVPFHFWAPDTYEGAPTPITAFLSVASKAAGFVALLNLVFIGFAASSEVWQPVFWILAALTMTVGNVIALRQTNIVRMLAYSSVAQAGFILVPLAVAGTGDAAGDSFRAVITYLLIYAATNLGAFAVVIAVARRTKSGEIASYRGLFRTSPGLAITMAAFLFSLAGIPPFGGWFAKFAMFSSALSAGGPWAVSLAVIAGANSVVALYYYANVAKEMVFEAPDAEHENDKPIRVPAPLGIAIATCVVAVIVSGVFPQTVARLSDETYPLGDVSDPSGLAAP
jgi:NADH-quinone oxidoreductase subunit N